MPSMAYTSIIGVSGYTGQETLDRVLSHPELELYAVGSDTLAGREAVALDPRLNRNGGRRVPHFITNEAALACEADVVFVCLPHDEAAALEPPGKGVVVDLSGAHRLVDPAQYERWYGFILRVPTSSTSGATAFPKSRRRKVDWLRTRGATRPPRCSRCIRFAMPSTRPRSLSTPSRG